MKPTPLYTILLCVYVLFAASCSNTKYLKEGQTLYRGAEVSIVDSNISKKEKKSLEEELEELIRPQPNRKLFGLKFRLWVWNVAGEPKKPKGIRHWLRTKVGEPPVLGEDLRLEANNLVLEDQMFNRGFFLSTADGWKEEKNKRTTAHFDVLAGPRYFFKNIEYAPDDSSQLAALIRKQQEESLLKVGDPYNLGQIVAERDRLGKILTNEGYYFFNPDYLLALADTSSDTVQGVDLRLVLKEEKMPKAAYQAFRINQIYIQPNYRVNANVNRRREAPSSDTLVTENFTVIDRRKSVRPIVFRESIQFEKGELYSEIEQNKTLSRLINTGLFKFVKSDFTVVRDPSTITGSLFDITYNTLLQRGIIASEDPKLDVNYLLTQYPRKRISVDVGGYTLNDSRVGSRLNFSWRHRNLFRGAEQFSVRGLVGVEVQYGGQNQRPNTYNLGFETSYTEPRFLVPFIKIKPSSAFLPKSTISAKYDFFLRTDLYRIHSGTLSFGYAWKETHQKEHKFNPINITYVKTDTFETNTPIQFQNILFNGLILGPTYEFTYNSQIGARRKHEFFFNGLADLSGNIIGLLQGADYRQEVKKILNNPYAQYVKLQADFRHYWNLSQNNTLASRVYAGYGLPYGNSEILPNVKQLFSGGISSVRGFNARMIGPGTYNERYLTGNNTYIEMLGDIKLEGNIEFRAKLYDFIHGAVFADAGNVWLRNEHPAFPGGKFSNKFFQELAVGTGIGIRLDFSVIMVRVDVGIPVRKPWLPAGQRWVFDQINFGNDVWRRENIVFGFAIGYPF